jgi:hypothetical protein
LVGPGPSLLSHQHLFHCNWVSLFPTLLGWQIFWKQWWRPLGFTNDT